MKKIIIILTLAFISCKEANQEPQVVYKQKYPYGTVIYVKPDSLKVVINNFDPVDGTYKVYWRIEGQYYSDWYSEKGFYGEEESVKDTLY